MITGYEMFTVLRVVALVREQGLGLKELHKFTADWGLLNMGKFATSSYNSTYLLTYLLISWCRIVFEKLIVTQLVKKYPASLRNPKVHYRVHKMPLLDPILSQLNPVRPIDFYLPKVHLNVILPPTPRSSQWSLAFGLSLITVLLSLIS
jgi:hypothetical protein